MRTLRALHIVVIGLVVGIGVSAESAEIPSTISWLVAHTGDPAFAARLTAAIDGSRSLHDVALIADRVVPVIPSSALRFTTALDLANLFRTARDYERAAVLYETAFIASGGTSQAALFAHAQLLVQRGELSGAEQRARTVVERTDDYELKRRAFLLVARVMQLSGRTAEASRSLQTLLALNDPDLVEPETALLLQFIDVPGAAGARATLERLHPDSVALRSLDAKQVIPAALPALLMLAPPWTPQGEPQPPAPAPPPPAAPTPTAVQVGSFADPDNAEHMVADLVALGLDARVVGQDRDGVRGHLVVVALGNDRDSGAAVMRTLSDAGFGGFLVY